MALTAPADEDHLREAYGVFASEAHGVEPECFLHGFLKIRDRCRKAHEMHRRVWDVSRAATTEEFRHRMAEFQQWCAAQTWTAPVRETLERLRAKTESTESYASAYDHPGCHRTSNAVDRPMNRLCWLMNLGRSLHGHQDPSESRLRGWALLQNFQTYAPRGKDPRTFESPPIGLTASATMSIGPTT